ncbi:MAG: DivIVA domain-containing protein [Actinomycetota bacterium]|nr:DivIVA domain-containing protein [Actinomycetota bacterium]
MPVAVTVCLIGLVVVLVTLHRDEPLEVPGPQEPDWDLLPTPSDVARVEFPLSFPGYDPATVEVYLDTLARAYGDLMAVAPPEVVARARRRAALRRGAGEGLLDDVGAAADRTVDEGSPASVASPADDAEALRLEAALERLHPTAGEPGLVGQGGDASADQDL